MRVVERYLSTLSSIALRDYLVPLRVFVLSRLGLFVLVYISLLLLPMRGPDFFRAHPDHLFVDGWSRWDSSWYASIIEHGYTNNVDRSDAGHGRDTAFFPLYPLTVGLLNRLIGDVHVSGLIVSNVCFVVALFGLHRLLIGRYGIETANRALVLIAVCPFSLFFSAMYTESLFLLSTVYAFLFCERRRYLLAGLFTAAAGATKVLGIFTLIGLLALYLRQIDFDWRKGKAGFAWLFLGVLGPVCYMFFLMMRFGDPFQFVKSQEAWADLNPVAYMGAVIFTLLSWKGLSGRPDLLIDLFHILSFFAAILLLLYTHRRLGWTYTLFSAVMIAGSFPRISSMGRYLVVVFPLFVAMAFVTENRRFRVPFLVANCLLLALLSVMFSHWYWVG